MEILKQRLNGSPYVGIFATVTEKIGLFPKNTPSGQLQKFEEIFGIESITINIANSALIGVLAIGNSKGFIVSEIAEEKEIEEMASIGLKVKKLPSIAAVGNLFELNDSKGVCSRIFSNQLKTEIEKFLGISIEYGTIAESDLIGSSMVATNKGFIMNPNSSKEEFNSIKKIFSLNGVIGTANYGDNFVGNSIIANSKGAIVGEQTSGYELIRIDEGLRD